MRHDDRARELPEDDAAGAAQDAAEEAAEEAAARADEAHDEGLRAVLSSALVAGPDPTIAEEVRTEGDAGQESAGVVD
ncbi:hypothetical protein PU560_08160, partial [Georgenia sp. 10Sc9-8]|nr:hypothetical protein [Georgenia halotolerans]